MLLFMKQGYISVCDIWWGAIAPGDLLLLLCDTELCSHLDASQTALVGQAGARHGSICIQLRNTCGAMEKLRGGTLNRNIEWDIE